MITQTAKSAYVSGMRAARTGLGATGAVSWLETRQSRRATWLRSLLAIYDLDDMERVGLPWWTFDAIAATEAFLTTRTAPRAFEWGSGASTLWLSSRCASVTSVEFDAGWYADLSAKLATRDNVELRLAEKSLSGTIRSAKPGFEDCHFDSFVAAIDAETEPFDLIVIDGRAREACLDRAAAHLAPGGIIVFDDTNRARYRAAIDASGLAARRYDGLAVSLPLPDSTTLIAAEAQTLNAF